MFALSLLRPVDKLYALDALLAYASARIQINDNLALLDSDAAWKHLLATPDGEKAQTSWSLAQLLEYKYDYPPAETSAPTPPGSTQGLQVAAKPAPNAPPGPPTAFRVHEVRRIEPLHRIADALTELGNGKRVTRSRAFSPLYDRSIYRWMIFRHRMVRESSSWKPCDKPQGTRSDSQWSAADFCREEFLATLSLPQIKQLAEFEAPQLREMLALVKEQDNVVLPNIGFPIAMLSAVFFVQAGILVSCLYFWLFFREARTSRAFPAAATLFGAFSRTTTSRVLLHVLAFVPPLAAGALATKSYSLTAVNVVPAVLTVFTAIATVRNIGWEPFREP